MHRTYSNPDDLGLAKKKKAKGKRSAIPEEYISAAFLGKYLGRDSTGSQWFLIESAVKPDKTEYRINRLTRNGHVVIDTNLFDSEEHAAAYFRKCQGWQ